MKNSRTQVRCTLHLLEVTSDGSGTFNVTLTDGGNPGNVFNTSWTNAGALGQDIGPRRSGPAGAGLFDNFTLNGDVQPFDTNTDAQTHYPNFTADLNGGGAVVQDGVLIMGTPAGQNLSQRFTTPGPEGEFALTALVGADASNGNYNVGVTIGENSIVFHPGFAGAALRVEGPGGFGNTNVGFTPGNGLLHLLGVNADGEGNFDITLTDAADPSNMFSTSFFNAGSIGGDIGFIRQGPTRGVGLFDNFVVIAPVPEPATAMLLVVGALVFMRRRRAV